jgi:hypothetical protein
VNGLLEVPFDRVCAVWDALDDAGENLQAARELALRDRYYLLVKVLGREDAWHPWIYDRCREVERHPDGYLDIWGRAHFKSSCITFAGSIQEILRDPEITIGIFSHSRPIAKAFLSQIKREFESNNLLRALFPDVLWNAPEREAPSWSLDAGLIVKRKGNPKEATLEAHGLVDGQPTSRHYALMIYDDVVTRESVSTPEQIAKTTEAWELSDNLGTANGRRWMTGTRYHFADSYAEMVKRGAARLRHRPATVDGTIEGTPVLLTRAQWREKVRDQGEATVACQLLGNPLAGKQRMFDVTDLQVYEVRPASLSVYVLVDPARSAKKDSCNTAMVVLGIDAAGNKYLLDGHDSKLDLMERWRRLRDLREKWCHAPGVYSVVVGYERFGAIADLDYFKERQRVEGEHFDIIELEWPREGPGSKIDRVQRLGPDLRGHRFYVPYATDPERLTKLQRKMVAAGFGYRIAQPIRHVDEDGKIYDLVERFRMQLSFFPYGGRNDLVDAASRLYDAEPTPPATYEFDLEPEYS